MADNNYLAFLNIFPNISNESIWTRLMQQLPPWFGNLQTFSDFNSGSGTNLNSVLWAFNVVDGNISPAQNPDPPNQKYNFYGNYAQYQYIVTQLRLGPDVDQFFPEPDESQLDLFAQDFFGNSLLRFPGELNPAYKLRIFANILNIRATRIGMFDALFNLTGNAPIIFEPARIFDAMWYGYDASQIIVDGVRLFPISHSAYGYARYGSLSYPYEGYVTVFLTPTDNLGQYPGYDLPAQLSPPTFPPYPNFSLGGYGATAVWAPSALIGAGTTQQQVVNTINNTKVFGTIVWFQIQYTQPI